MPEGHIIHRLAKELNQTLGGRSIAVSSPQGRFAAGAARLDGQVLTRSEAWGKYLFSEFGTGDVLFIHLGLIGKLRRREAPIAEPVGQVRLRLMDADPGAATVAWDLSGPTRCEVIDPGERERIVAGLGADPLRRNPDVAAARARFAASSRPVGTLVLDQSVIAGIGNVYRAELLFRAGINPARPADTLGDAEFEGLWGEAVELMRVGKRLGRIVTTEPAEIGTTRGRMHEEDRLYVYQRETCRRCGTTIRETNLGGRSIWYCPTCQPVDWSP